MWSNPYKKRFHLRDEGGRAEQGQRHLEMEGHGAGRADLINEERDEGQSWKHKLFTADNAC